MKREKFLKTGIGSKKIKKNYRIPSYPSLHKLWKNEG
jgi:hypothetical protein